MIAMNIDVATPTDPLVEHAACELSRYVRALFGFTPARDLGEAEHTVAIALDAEMSDQTYQLARRSRDLTITAGSPRAVLWAVYELIGEWGVHFLVQGDVFPDDPGPFRLPDLNVTRSPILRRRDFRCINDMANSGVFWSLDQHKNLFDQLAKLRFTGIYIQTYPHQPWAHYTFRGIERCTAGLCYGWKHPIHAGTIGRELLLPGDEHTNADFAHCRTYEQWIAAGRRFMRGLFDAARARGLEVTYDHPTSEVPDEFAYKLAELSKAEGVDYSDQEGFGQSHFSRHGLTYSGSNAEVERYRTPLNPVYVDLMEASFVAHVQAYPDADRYAFTEQEFPPGGAGEDECWRQLDEKYHLSDIITLDEIKKRSREQFFYREDRAYHQAMGAIQSLHLYDQLINERNVLQHATHPTVKIIIKFFSEHLQPLVEHVFSPEIAEFNAIVDYLPARVAERMDTLAYVKDGNLDVMMITTVEDDNVGFLPQLNTQSLHRTVQEMRRHGLIGFMFRQFDIAQHEPCMAYMVESSWDETITPEDSYRRYAERVAGADAVDDLLAAFEAIEQLTEDSNAMIGQGFMWPSLYSSQWYAGAEPVAEWSAYMESLEQIEDTLREALGKTAPRGRRLVCNYMTFVRFARQFVEMKNTIRAARMKYDAAKVIGKRGDLLEYHPVIGQASDLLFEAVAQSERAIRTWASQVADATDAGSLAGLNAYGHDWLRGLAVKVYWQSQCYGGMLE